MVSAAVDDKNHPIYCPPLISSVTPVIYLDLSLARKVITSATSSGLPERLKGTASGLKCVKSLVISVSINPGATAFTFTPNGPAAFANDMVKATIAPFEVARKTHLLFFRCPAFSLSYKLLCSKGMSPLNLSSSDCPIVSRQFLLSEKYYRHRRN
jgi:hypothetical protein